MSEQGFIKIINIQGIKLNKYFSVKYVVLTKTLKFTKRWEL